MDKIVNEKREQKQKLENEKDKNNQYKIRK